MNPEDELVNIVRFINPPLLKDGGVIGIRAWVVKNDPVKPDEMAEAEAAIIRAFEIPSEVLEAHSEFDEMRKTMDSALRREMLRLEREFIEGFATGFNEPAQPALYPENYKSAVVDKDGKVIKVIE